MKPKVKLVFQQGIPPLETPLLVWGLDETEQWRVVEVTMEEGEQDDDGNIVDGHDVYGWRDITEQGYGPWEYWDMGVWWVELPKTL